MKYTVLVMRNDSDNCDDTFLAHVEARNKTVAGDLAKHEAIEHDTGEQYIQGDLETWNNYSVLLVLFGHHEEANA